MKSNLRVHNYHFWLNAFRRIYASQFIVLMHAFLAPRKLNWHINIRIECDHVKSYVGLFEPWFQASFPPTPLATVDAVNLIIHRPRVFACWAFIKDRLALIYRSHLDCVKSNFGMPTVNAWFFNSCSVRFLCSLKCALLSITLGPKWNWSGCRKCGRSGQNSQRRKI